MIVLKPLNPKSIVSPGQPLYRGFLTDRYSSEIKKDGRFSPKNPLNIRKKMLPYEIVDLVFGKRRPLKHIRGMEKGRFVSFSLRKHVSCYYATSKPKEAYRHFGYIAVVRFPDIRNAITIGGGCPYIYECADGTTWIDLRNSPIGENNVLASVQGQSRTMVDHELLLARGAIKPFQILPVMPKDCNKKFLPWAEWGEKIFLTER